MTDAVNADQAISDAIIAATTSAETISIDTKKFIAAFNSHRDRRLCCLKLQQVSTSDFAGELRKWWAFDDRQMHTHSWHDRENFIERQLPKLLAVKP